MNKIVVVGDLKIHGWIIDLPKMFKISAPVSMGARSGALAPGNADTALHVRGEGVSPNQIKWRTRPHVGRKERPRPLIGVIVIPMEPILTDKMLLTFADHGGQRERPDRGRRQSGQRQPLMLAAGPLRCMC